MIQVCWQSKDKDFRHKTCSDCAYYTFIVRLALDVVGCPILTLQKKCIYDECQHIWNRAGLLVTEPSTCILCGKKS